MFSLPIRVVTRFCFLSCDDFLSAFGSTGDDFLSVFEPVGELMVAGLFGGVAPAGRAEASSAMVGDCGGVRSKTHHGRGLNMNLTEGRHTHA